jgi:heat shock protein HslJ
MAPGLCRDDMTGMPHPETVTITLEGRQLRGCGGDPRDLLTGAEWVVQDIEGRGIVDSSRVTLNFAEDGGLSGTASCNRYATRFEISGEGVSIGQIAATQMMCPEALMTQERAVFAALAAVGRFDIDADWHASALRPRRVGAGADGAALETRFRRDLRPRLA